MRIDLPDPAATAALAAALAARAQMGDVIALSGGLGVGKTTFARGFIEALSSGETPEVPSPTFTLVQAYEFTDATVYHFDLYRIERAEECYELGIEDAFAEGISLIEWPDRLGSLLPEDRLDIELAPGATLEGRVAHLTFHGAFVARAAAFEGFVTHG